MPFINPKFLNNHDWSDTDSEFQADPDVTAKPLTVQCKDHNGVVKTFIHPKSELANHPDRRHEVFTAPLVQLNSKKMEWKKATEEELKKCKKTHVIAIEMFATLQDVRNSCWDDDLFREILKHISVTRRVKIQNGKHDTIRLPYLVQCSYGGGWKVLSVRIMDYSALLGAVSLKSYAKITGVKMESKDNFTRQEKSEMYRMYLERPDDFDAYAEGDCVLHEIMLGAEKLFDYICNVLNIDPPKYYGMSTGKIVARIISKAIAKLAGFVQGDPDEDHDPVNAFSAVCKGSHPKFIQFVCSALNSRDVSTPFIAMVDGGRATNATLERILEGVLADVDVGGCYANGLINQLFPIGSPTKIVEKMSLREFIDKYKRQFIPGLWQARISTKKGYKLSFKQDLFISKVERKFTLWENNYGFDDEGWLCIEDFEVDSRVYDAAMVKLNRELHQTLLNHDLLQICQKYFSKNEWGELLDNCFIESALIYEKRNYRPNIDVNTMEGASISLDTNVEISGTKLFKYVSLKEIVLPLLLERKKIQADPNKGKKSPEDLILKLILNTIYGCIASPHFDNIDDGISNVVVGNNITARVRTVAWTMEKSLGTCISVTDGGVADINKVVVYVRTSAQIFTDLFNGVSIKESDRSHNFKFVPLFGELMDFETAIEKLKTDENKNGEINLDKILWDHAAKTFSKLDIYSGNDGKGQFYFETKSIHDQLIKHNKVDYALRNQDGTYKYALRGCKKVELTNDVGEIVKDKSGDPVMTIVDEGVQLFEDVKLNKASVYEVTSTKMLGFAEWKQDCKSENPKYGHLFPHDTISVKTRFFSITPLGCEFDTMAEYKNMVREYIAAKNSDNPAKNVAEVAYKYGYPRGTI